MRDESMVERVVRATNHCRAALLAGYTTYRDLGSEGMESLDANLRDCINRGLVPGPRLFVATHALAGTGGYDLRSENAMNGVRLPHISEPCDGPDAVRRAVRKRVAAGADVIKFYADYRRKVMRFPQVQAHSYAGSIQFLPKDPNPAVPLFCQEEMDVIVEEAKLADLPVAAHAGTLKGAMMAVRAGVTSLEHGTEPSEELFHEMKRQETIYVPTLAVFERLADQQTLRRLQRMTRTAHEIGVRVAAGGDTGAFNHGENAREMELMIQAGIPVEDVLEACTIGGWEACGGGKCGFKFGWFDEGNRADLIALESDPREDKDALRRVEFVMKDGRVWKRGGKPVGMVWRFTNGSLPSERDEDWVMV
jgi:imidazolonepropionase-like amidohydrolase